MKTEYKQFLIILNLIVLTAAVFSQTEEKTGNIITNSIGMNLVYVPAGSFMMGSPFDEPGRQDDEFLHQVTITRPFRIATTEVSQAQWMAVMGTNRSQFKADSLPVEKISWKDAALFCQKLSEKEGRIYRLPAEAEWEYACRAGSNDRFAGSDRIEEIAWYVNNSGAGSHAVGSKRPNAWGLYDMLGNVSEWCLDYYDPAYPEQPVEDPAGPEEGKYRVIRGGAWDTFLPGCRCAARSSAPSSYQFKQTGFRVLMELH